MAGVGKLFILMGVVLIITGILLLVAPRMPLAGRLPGDLLIKREHLTVYVPLTTSIIVSLLLSLLFWLFRSK